MQTELVNILHANSFIVNIIDDTLIHAYDNASNIFQIYIVNNEIYLSKGNYFKNKLYWSSYSKELTSINELVKILLNK